MATVIPMPKLKGSPNKDPDLEYAFRFCEKVKKFEAELKKEMKEHPDYRAEPINICYGLVYIVLKRESNGVKYIQDVEVEL